MASRYRSFSKPTINLLKSTISSPALKPTTSPLPTLRSFHSIPRSVSQLGCLQSLLPLHTAVASARLISGLGIDPASSRSMSQEMGLSVPR